MDSTITSSQRFHYVTLTFFLTFTNSIHEFNHRRSPMASASPKARSKGSLRGLLIGSPHIHRFFEPVLSRKTHEVRNFNLRVVQNGGSIYLIESGVKDSFGSGVFKIHAKAEFRGNTFVSHEEFSSHSNKHRCTKKEYEAVRANWKNDKGGCALWELIVVEKFAEPLYIAPRRGEERVLKVCNTNVFKCVQAMILRRGFITTCN